jgi:hypothetical protein
MGEKQRIEKAEESRRRREQKKLGKQVFILGKSSHLNFLKSDSNRTRERQKEKGKEGIRNHRQMEKRSVLHEIKHPQNLILS